MTFVQIGEFDWLSGRQKGSIFVKIFKKSSAQKPYRMKPKLGIHALDISLYYSLLFVQPDILDIKNLCSQLAYLPQFNIAKLGITRHLLWLHSLVFVGPG